MAYTRNVKWEARNSGTWSLNSSTFTTNDSVTATDSKTGQRNPGWRTRISKGSDAGSAYSRTAYKYKSEPSSCAIKSYYRFDFNTKRNISVNAVINGNQSLSSLTLSDPGNEALSKLYSKIKEKQEGMNGLLVLGELRETIKMLRQPGEALINLFGEYLGTSKGLRQQYSKRKGGGNRRELEKALSGLWLEYSFGWKPLISDVRDLATTVARIAYDNALRTDRARGMAGTEAALVDAPFFDSGPVTSDPAPRFLHCRVRHSELGVKYVAGINASTYGPTDRFDNLRKETGLVLDNFVPTVWNLIPYSFLVDYFVNVGDCIDAVFTDTSAVKWWSRTERRIDKTSLSSSFDAKLTSNSFTGADYVIQSSTGKGGSVEFIRTTLVRTVGTVLPLPGLTLSMPGVDSSKYWNMLALWRGKASGTYFPGRR